MPELRVAYADMKTYFELDSFIETIVDALLIVEGLQVFHVQFPKATIQIVIRFGYGCRAPSPPLENKYIYELVYRVYLENI